METEEIKLLKRISAQVGAVEAKIDANALAMTGLSEKLDRLEIVVGQLEKDVANGKRNTLVLGSISGAAAGVLSAIGWELIKARMGM